jgi:hypothetical protein
MKLKLKMVTCFQCGKVLKRKDISALTTSSGKLSGWTSISETNISWPPKGEDDGMDFCSNECLLSFVKNLVEKGGEEKEDVLG